MAHSLSGRSAESLRTTRITLIGPAVFLSDHTNSYLVCMHVRAMLSDRSYKREYYLVLDSDVRKSYTLGEWQGMRSFTNYRTIWLSIIILVFAKSAIISYT